MNFTFSSDTWLLADTVNYNNVSITDAMKYYRISSIKSSG